MVEMLTLIAIVAILSAILIPSFKNVQNKARETQCAAKLRNIATGFNVFIMDHSGRYPLSFDHREGGMNAVNNNWLFHIAPYLGATVHDNDWNSIIRACAPNAPLGCPIINATDPAFIFPWVSYKMTSSHHDWLEQNGGFEQGGVPAVQIDHPAQSLLVSEGRDHSEFSTWETTPRSNGLDYRHGGKVNALFADGHVTALSLEDMKANWDTWYVHAIK